MLKLRTIRRTSLAAALLLLLALPAAGCGGGTDETYETVSEGVLQAGQPVPAPSGKPVIQIGGKVGTTNDGKQLKLDLATIEQLGLIRYSVKDPWLKREVSYTGVLLSDLVDLTQPASSAKTIHLVALDDYEVEIKLADVRRWPIMLATELDGKRMPIGNGGPTRIVFPYGQVDGLDELKYKDLWIWNIRTATFR